MKPSRFRYFVAHTVDEAVTLLAEHGDNARVLAGGQSLVALMNMRLARPDVLVDINEVGELASIQLLNGNLSLGALTRIAALQRSELVSSRFSLLAEAAAYVGHSAIRHRGTVGGSITHADPAAELPAVMLALDAEFVVRRVHSIRTIAARDFFHGPFQTALEPGELLTELRIPSLPARSGSTFVEFSRREGDYALVGVAAVVMLTEEGTISQIRLGLCGVGTTALRLQTVETLLCGQRPDSGAWATAAAAVIPCLKEPPSDIHGSADYRRHLAGVMTERALALAARRAERND